MKKIVDFIQDLSWGRIMVALVVLAVTIFNPLSILPGWLRIVLLIPAAAVAVVWFVGPGNVKIFLLRTTFLVRYWENLAAVGVGFALWVLTSWLAPTGNLMGLEIPGMVLALIQSTPLIILGALYSWFYFLTLRKEFPRALLRLSGSALRPITTFTRVLWMFLPASLIQIMFGFLSLEFYVSLPLTVLMVYAGYQMVYRGSSDALGFRMRGLGNETIELGEQKVTYLKFLGTPLPIDIWNGVALAPSFLSFGRVFAMDLLPSIEARIPFYDKDRIELQGQFFLDVRVYSAYAMVAIGGGDFFDTLKAGSVKNPVISSIQIILESVGSHLPAEVLFVASQLGALLKTMMQIHANNGEVPAKLQAVLKKHGIDEDELKMFVASDYFSLTPDGKSYLALGAVTINDPIKPGDVRYVQEALQRMHEEERKEQKQRKGEAEDLKAKSEQIEELVKKKVSPLFATLAIYARDIFGK